MQIIALAISCLSARLLVNGEETCGKWEDPRDPVHFSPTHGGQWRLLATEGQKQDGTIIKTIPGESTAVIRGHWAIGELEFYADPNCEGSKYPTLLKDTPVLSPIHTTYGWQDDAPDAPDSGSFLASLGEEAPWYPEMRAIDGCSTSEFWSQCYQCDASSAWFGVKFDDDDLNATHIKCVKMFQKDADAYTATRVELHRWYPNISSCKTNEDGATTCDGWAWKKVGDWTGLDGGQWYVLRDNTTVAINSAHGSAGLGIVGVIGFLLWAMQ